MVKSTQPKSATKYLDTAFGILPRSKIIPLEAEGIKKAQTYIVLLSQKKNKITPELICNVHRQGFGFIFPGWAGKFRIIDVTVGEYEPPHYSHISELVKSLCDDLQERLGHLSSTKQEDKFLAEIITIIAWFQHRFVWIHPFNDYNGRLARLLTNLTLLNLDLPILTIKVETDKDRENYVDAMKEADKHYFSKLEILLSKALKESLEEV